MKFKHFLGLIILFIAAFANAQTVEINGAVLDSKTQLGIPGVNISIKKTKKGVVADLDGKYSIKVNMNDIVVFSNIGYNTDTEFF